MLLLKCIDGSEDHFRSVHSAVKNITGKANYLHLQFECLDDELPSATPEVARQFSELFMRAEAFKEVRTLKLEIRGNSNFAEIFRLINSQKSEFPWFQSVETLKFYEVADMKDLSSIKEFLLNFRNLKLFKGKSDATFDPLLLYHQAERHVDGLSWSLPDTD